ncbi:hypothetical protein HZB04_02215 [Candidatus Wolfebacteria bacterium]|nr:hypothetical protein [Candidatus Wolfebacteria bacterium]
MAKIKNLKQRGYIALTSAIIISGLIMLISLALSFSSVSNRFDILGAEFKKNSRALSEACAETALLKLAQNSAYAGNKNIQIASSSCSILAIESSGGQKIIKTKTNLQNFITNLKITTTAPDVAVVFWEEVANF